MTTYSGIYIFNIEGKEDGIEGAIQSVEKEIAAQGGRVQRVQKMEKRDFERVADKKVTSGFYVNIILDLPPEKLVSLNKRLTLNEFVFRQFYVKDEGKQDGVILSKDSEKEEVSEKGTAEEKKVS